MVKGALLSEVYIGDILTNLGVLLAYAAVLLSLGLRGLITWRMREPWWSVPLHPFARAVALAIQWWALVRWALGKPAGWKGRAYPATKAA